MRWLLTITLVALSLTSIPAQAAEEAEALAAKYVELRAQLRDSVYGEPLHILSSEEGEWLKGEVYGIIDHPFERAEEALSTPDAWCEILFLHPNVKACVVQPENGAGTIQLYMGRKYYQPPGEAYLTTTRFDIPQRGNGHLRVTAEAGEGPFGLEGYTIALDAIPLDEGRTFVHFAYAVRYSTLTHLALTAYFATLGSGKVGFTRNGEGELVRGTRGMIERNAMRNYLAVAAHLEGLALLPHERQQGRLAAWFEASERHPRQLRELEWDEYRSQKEKELAEQLRLTERAAP